MLLSLGSMLDKSARLRDGRGRYPRSPRPDFESIIAGFGESWSSWRTLAIATQSREAQSVERSPQSAERSSSLDQQEGGATPPEIESRRPQHWASNKFFDQKLYQECTGRETIPKGQLKKSGRKSVEAGARQERPVPHLLELQSKTIRVSLRGREPKPSYLRRIEARRDKLSTMFVEFCIVANF